MSVYDSNLDPNVYYKPKHNIPESKKTKIWIQQNANWIISTIPSTYNNNLDREAYNLFNGFRDDTQWDHITKTYGIEFPAGKLKHTFFIIKEPPVNQCGSFIIYKHLLF